MNPSRLLNARVESLNKEGILLIFSDGQKLRVPESCAPKDLTKDDTVSIAFIKKDPSLNTDKELGQIVLKELLRGV